MIKLLHHLLETIRIYAWSWYLQNLASVGAIRWFIVNVFANQNFSRHRKAELLRNSITLVLRVKFRFMGCLVKANALVLRNIALSLSSQLIVLVFTKQLLQEQPPDAFCKKGVLLRKVFTKFIGKGLCQRLYFNKLGFLRL